MQNNSIMDSYIWQREYNAAIHTIANVTDQEENIFQNNQREMKCNREIGSNSTKICDDMNDRVLDEKKHNDI